MEDTFEGLEDDDLEEEADKAVDKILFEVTNGEAHAGVVEREMDIVENPLNMNTLHSQETLVAMSQELGHLVNQDTSAIRTIFLGPISFHTRGFYVPDIVHQRVGYIRMLLKA